MPAIPLISIQGLSSAYTVGHRAVQKTTWLGGGQYLAWFIGKWEASTKSFQTKGINIICEAMRLPGAQYGSDLATCSLPRFCEKDWWGLPRNILAVNVSELEHLFSPPLYPVLLPLSLSRLDNGWSPTCSRDAQKKR